MNPGYARRTGRVWTVALGVVLTGLDLAVSALLWGMVIALLPDVIAWGALAGFALVSLALVGWPRPGRAARLLAFWSLPVELLRRLAVGWRRWLARFPFLELVWRTRFIVGIAAIVQNSLEGTPLLGLIPAGIIAVSYLWPWLRRVHARRAETVGRPRVERLRKAVATDAIAVPSGRAEPQKGALQ